MEKKKEVKVDFSVSSLLSEIDAILATIDDSNAKESSAKLMKLARDFFSEIFRIKYQFDFNDLYRVMKLKKIDDNLKMRVFSFFREISSIGYMPHISKEKLLLLIKEFRELIENLKSIGSISKKVKVNKKDKRFIKILRRRFLSKKKLEKLRREETVIRHLNIIIKKTMESIEEGNPRINSELIGYIYNLYHSLPKNKRSKVDTRINQLFKQISTMSKSKEKLFSKFSPASNPRGLLDIEASSGVSSEMLVKQVVNADKSQYPKHYLDRARVYIEKMFKKGFDENSIKEKMMEVGWPEEVVAMMVNDYIIGK